MASTDDEKNEKLLEAALSGTLTRTADWLKFAETKNAALLTFSSAWLIAMSNLKLGNRPPSSDVSVALGWASIFIVFAAGFAISALLPKIHLWGKPKKSHRNLLYYGQLENKTGQWIFSEMKATYLNQPSSTYSEAYLLDLSDQVSDISHVASRKFRLFAFGAYSVGLGLAAFIISLWGTKVFAVAASLYQTLTT
nr:Pycsar system effector family protein [uncultured Brevundimonas sp.]